MNAIAQRWTGGACRRELLDHALVWNQAHPRRILRDYETHHNQHRPHCGGANDGRSKTSTLRVIFPPATVKHSAVGASLAVAVCG
jgi:hypothetical protein